MSFSQIFIIALLIGLNAFFVGVEFAVVASRRARLDLLAAPDSWAARLVRAWLEDVQARDRLIAASQLGITLVSLALGSVSEKAFFALLAPAYENLQIPPNLQFLGSLLPFIPLLLTLTVITSFHVILGEQVPKVAVLRGPERFALLAAPAMNIFITIFWGSIHLLDWATRLVLKLFGMPANGHAHSTVMTADELKQMVTGPDVEGAIETPEREMISAVIEFGALVVRQVMIPRIEINAVEASAPIAEAIQTAAKYGVTKLPVYEETLDQVVGVLHVKDLLPLLQEEGFQQRTARELAREALFVPETVSVNNLLLMMRDRRQHMAITLDEFGGTAGLVTLEDLLEEIVGEVRDEFDQALPDIEILPDGSALLDGMAMIEDVNEKFGLNLYDPNYDTIAGFMLGRLGRIPQDGDVVDDAELQVRLKVDQMERLRIARIHLSRL